MVAMYHCVIERNGTVLSKLGQGEPLFAPCVLS